VYFNNRGGSTNYTAPICSYQKVRGKLENQKSNLLAGLQSPSLASKEKETLYSSIDNLEYILEWAEMNDFEGGNRK